MCSIYTVPIPQYEKKINHIQIIIEKKKKSGLSKYYLTLNVAEKNKCQIFVGSGEEQTETKKLATQSSKKSDSKGGGNELPLLQTINANSNFLEKIIWAAIFFKKILVDSRYGFMKNRPYFG